MKYELTAETIQTVFGVTLYRIRYIETGKLGGFIQNEKNLSQDGNAQVSGDARVFGNAWEASPLQIVGTKFFFSVSSKNTITVGCMTKTFEEWQVTYEKEFEKHGFTEKQRFEYKAYFNLASSLYGWGVILPMKIRGKKIKKEGC
jgi:hypothetical protein